MKKARFVSRSLAAGSGFFLREPGARRPRLRLVGGFSLRQRHAGLRGHRRRTPRAGEPAFPRRPGHPPYTCRVVAALCASAGLYPRKRPNPRSDGSQSAAETIIKLCGC